MLNRRVKKGGFTLPEVLVTVAIVAVLAAVIVPAVTQQLGKGDAPALKASIGSIQSSIAAFVADVRKFPRRLSDMSIAIVAADSTLHAGQTYGTQAAARWRGPYMASTLAPDDSLTLGMNLKGFDSLSIETDMIKMRLTGSTSHADMSAIDTLIDNATGPTAGNLRWTNTTGTASLLYYLLGGSR
jgi:prepilin-type N-terminal cleavage/methylation domain-containing protein